MPAMGPWLLSDQVGCVVNCLSLQSAPFAFLRFDAELDCTTCVI